MTLAQKLLQVIENFYDDRLAEIIDFQNILKKRNQKKLKI